MVQCACNDYFHQIKLFRNSCEDLLFLTMLVLQLCNDLEIQFSSPFVYDSNIVYEVSYAALLNNAFAVILNEISNDSSVSLSVFDIS